MVPAVPIARGEGEERNHAKEEDDRGQEEYKNKE